MRWKGPRPTRKVVGTAMILGSLLIAWWWPGLTGQDQQTDVMIMSSRSLVQSQEIIDRRLREQGFTTDWTSLGSDECSIESPSGASFEVLVFEMADTNSCPVGSFETSVKSLRSELKSRPLVAVVGWSDADPAESTLQLLRDLKITLVDPRSLIGEEGVSQPCLWWDDCPLDGWIVTIGNGRLTEAGMQRLARSIVTGVVQ